MHKRVIINKYIVADPNICHGKPTFKGTRIMVWQVLEMLSDGAVIKEIIDGFPSLKPEHIQAALAYASELTSDNHILVKITPSASQVSP